MIKEQKDKLNGLKLNKKFTLVIIFLVVIPISILAGVLFRNMEQNVKNENINYMQYTIERQRDNIKKNVDSVSMTTQFFLSDTSLKRVLEASVNGKQLTTEEIFELYNSDIASLERLVNNNLLLHGVRVYAINDNVQEMMPILYNSTRMKRMKWAEKENYAGWNFNYSDVLFETQSTVEKDKIASLVTPIENYESGQIGVIEAAVSMENLFPSLYEDIENEWSCFVSDDGNIYFGDKFLEDSEEFVRRELEGKRNKGEVCTNYIKQGREHLIVSYTYIKEIGGTLFSVQNITENMWNVYKMRNSFLAILFVLIIGLGYLINLVVKSFLKQFYNVLKSIRKIQKGDLTVRIDNCGTDEIGELGNQINKMLDLIERLMKESIDREVLVKNSEIRALQNQINAHFIYNVLESIKMMAEIDEEYAISDAITSLGKLLRYSMRWVSGNVLVEEEVEYIKNYLALINLRFDYEIYLSLNIPPMIMRQEIPKMSLQPIIENAICHGVEELAEDTNIYMKGYVQGTDCIIEIKDAGKGMTEEEVEKLRKKIAGEIETSGGSGNGIGLKNVQDRIRISFGEEYGIGIDSKLGCYTKITVRIPLQENLQEGKITY